MSSHNHIAIIQDSIFNSVFDSQVIKPLQRYLQKNYTHRIIIISFEKNLVSSEKIAQIIPKEFTFIQLKQKPFMGLWSQTCSIMVLKQVLSNFQTYTIVARGPLAGYLAVRAQTQYCKHIVIQARGLLAQEYGYTYKNSQNFIVRLWHKVRQKLYYILEKSTYCVNTTNVTFEAVSPALKEYLITMYDTAPDKITIAVDDIPAAFLPKEKKTWRSKIRKQLSIHEHTYVYCYNGSAKPWQCPFKVVQFFYEKLHKNPESFLLILSQDTEIFISLLKKYDIANKYYHAAHIPHEQIFWYLAAADAGLLFREPHIINWVSRPTKALEYRAMQLTIIHNNTVAYVAHEPQYIFSSQ